MRYAAAAMVSLAILLAGSSAVELRRKSARSLEKIEEMINFIESLMRFERPPLDELMSRLVSDCRFDSLTFLKSCETALESGESFHTAWNNAVNEKRAECCLSRENAQRLCAFGDCLGATDAEGQLSSCSLYSGFFGAELEKADERLSQARKMCVPVSMLACAAAAVILL